MLRVVDSKKNKRNLILILIILSAVVLFLTISAVAQENGDNYDSRLFEFRTAIATGSSIKNLRTSYLKQETQGISIYDYQKEYNPIFYDFFDEDYNILFSPETISNTCDPQYCLSETTDIICNLNVTFDQETCDITGICETTNGVACNPTSGSTCGYGSTCDASCTPTCSATCGATCGSTCSGLTCGGQGVTYDGTCLGTTCQIDCPEEEEDPCMSPGPGCFVAIEPEGWSFPAPRPDPFYYRSNSTVTFHAFVVPMLNQGVEWVIVQGESHVEIVAQHGKWLILNLTSPGTVIIEALSWLCEPCVDTFEFVIVSEDLSYIDSDNDGLTDLEEYLLGTNPFYYDTDGDGLPDGWEVEYGFDPLDDDSDDDGISDALEDPDGDGLTNHDEFIYGTNPRLYDSDGDGVSDGDEVAQGSDPNNGSDGGLPPPPEDLVNVTLTIGDISGSHSEHWMMRIGQINFKAPGYGQNITRVFRFLRGKSYKIEVLHLGTNLGTPDYDYIALVDVDDDLALIIDNDNLLGVHWSQECPEGCNMAENKIAWLNLSKVDIDGDSNHDTNIDEQDDPIEEDLPGVIVLCNVDDDNNDGVVDNGNNTPDNVLDSKDLTPLILRQMEPIDNGWIVELSFQNPNNTAPGVSRSQIIRVFSDKNSGAETIMGPGIGDSYVLPQTAGHGVDIDHLKTGDIELWVEGLEFAGEVELFFIAISPDGYVGLDTIQLKVAPLILLGHNQPVNKSFVCYDGTPESLTYCNSFKGLLPAGVNWRRIEPSENNGDPWAQDEFQICYQQAPYKDMYVVLDSPRNGGLDTFVKSLLAPDFGHIEINNPIPYPYNSLNCFGNLEVSPPCTVGGTDYPLGRIYYGDWNGISGRRMYSELRDFLDRQQVQGPVTFYSDWLRVGHVDEFMSIIPDFGGTYGWTVLLANASLAVNLLQSVDYNLSIPQYDGQYWVKKVGDLLEMPSYHGTLNITKYNLDVIQPILNNLKEDVITAFNLSASDIIEIPVLFEESNNGALAVTPDLVNGGVYSNVFIAPDTFLCNRSGSEEDVNNNFLLDPGEDGNNNLMLDTHRDIFCMNLTDKLPSIITVKFIDNWELYHIECGEVHCSSNEQRQLPSTLWWE